jgi:hypothetical protein
MAWLLFTLTNNNFLLFIYSHVYTLSFEKQIIILLSSLSVYAFMDHHFNILLYHHYKAQDHLDFILLTSRNIIVLNFALHL